MKAIFLHLTDEELERAQKLCSFYEVKSIQKLLKKTLKIVSEIIVEETEIKDIKNVQSNITIS